MLLTAASPRLRRPVTIFASLYCAGMVLSRLLLSNILLLSSIVRADTEKNLSTKLGELGYEQGESVDRVEHYRVNGWNYIDDQHIVIYAGPGSRFLITTLNLCRDLSTAENIGFTTTSSSVTKFDKLVVRGVGGIPQNCPITQINKLTKTEKKR